MAKATVFNPQTGQRKVVTVGDPKAFEGGFQLEKKSPLDKTLTGTRSLPDDDSQLTNMQSVLRMLKTESDKAQPSPLSKLQNFESITGIKPITTGAITGAIEMGEKERFADIAERSRTLVDLIGEQEERKEQQRKDNLKWAETLFSSVENPFTVFSADDIENMKLGIITPEMKAKAGKARTVELTRARAVTGIPTGAPTPVQPVAPQVTFESFLQKEQEKAGRSFGVQKREELRRQFDELQKVDATSFDSLVRLTISGQLTTKEALEKTTSKAHKTLIIEQLAQAEQMGLLKEKGDKQVIYEKDRAIRVLSMIDSVSIQVKGGTTGLDGKLKSNIPGTESFNLARSLESLKANIGFQELAAMRVASPTGGALGQVAIQELDFLQAVLGSLDQGQSEQKLKENIERIKEHYNNWLSIVQQGGSVQTQAPDIRSFIR